MKLEDLVPPFDLCKLIPAGEFEDSAFVYILYKFTGNEPKILPREHEVVKIFLKDFYIYPAPTVAEIMEKMPYSKLKRTQNTFFFERKHVTGAWSGGYNPAEAALQVWLNFKRLI